MTNIINEYSHFFKNLSKNIKLYFVILFIAAFLPSAHRILLSIYIKNIGFNETFIGQMLSIQTFGLALGAIPITLFAQRFNKKKTLIIGFTFMMFGSLSMLNIKIPIIMKISALVFGIGQATTMILQAPIIFENAKSEFRTMAFSVAFVLQNITFVLSSFLLGHISDYISIKTNPIFANLVVLNSASFMMILAIFLTLKFKGNSMTKTNTDISFIHDIIDVLKNYKSLLKGKTLKYLMQIAIIGLGAGMIVPFFSIYLKHTLSIKDGTVGNIMAISQIGTIIGGILVPIIAKKIGNVKSILVFQLLSIPFLITISFSNGLYFVTIAFFFRSSLMNMVNPLFTNLGMEITTKDKRTHMSGIRSLTSNLFRAIGIYIGGYLMYKFNYNTPYYFTIICYLIGTGIIYKVFYKNKSSL